MKGYKTDVFNLNGTSRQVAKSENRQESIEFAENYVLVEPEWLAAVFEIDVKSIFQRTKRGVKW